MRPPSFDGLGTPRMKDVVLTESDEGRTVRLEAGDTVTIMVPENPTSGYRWTLEENGDEPPVRVSSDFSLAPSSLIGGGGLRTFKVLAIKPGIVQLHFKHWRQFQGEPSVQRRLDVTLAID